MKKNVVFLLILSLIFSVLFLVVYFLFNEQDSKTENKPLEIVKDVEVLVFNNNDALKYEDGAWFISNANSHGNKEFKVYDGNNYVGEKFISYSDGWYVNDKDMNFYDINDSLFAHYGDYSLKYIGIEYLDLIDSDQFVIENFLNSKNLEYVYSNLEILKSAADIDGDLELEYFYSILNSDSLDEITTGKQFNYYIMIDNNEIKEFDNIDQDCGLDLQNIVNLDSKDYVILSCTYPSVMGSIIKLYEYNGNFNFIIQTNLK